MKQAIIRLNKNQYQISEGEEILVDKLINDKPEIEVLYFNDGKNVKVGTPVLNDAKVKFEILEPEAKGKKLYVRKFRAKSRYRRKIGFRPVYSKIKIVSIS